MKTRPLWKVAVLTTEATEDAVAELLTARLGQPAASYTDLETGRTTVAVYLQVKPPVAKLLKEGLQDDLKQILVSQRGSEREIIRLSRLRSEDWANSWKRHFKPLEIGKSLLVKPSWSRRQPKPGQAVVMLDPGMSFGTGQHPTTAFCLKELTRLRKNGQAQSFLDVGTGSGILAISAAKLGYRPVHALDLDPVSIQVSRANARRNRVSRQIQFKCKDFTKIPHVRANQYSVVCANLLADLLLSEKGRLMARVQKGGHVVVAGILREEFGKIRSEFMRAGFRQDRIRVEKEWCSGTFVCERITNKREQTRSQK
jgi:ribosomal protein L11 methyltransferase